MKRILNEIEKNVEKRLSEQKEMEGRKIKELMELQKQHEETLLKIKEKN